MPLQTLALTGNLGDYGMRDGPLVIPVSFDPGQPDDFKDVADELEPRVDLKPHPGAFPLVDRTHKGDPAIGLRPTFDSELRPSGRAREPAPAAADRPA